MKFFNRLQLIGVLHVVSHPRRTLLIAAIILAATCGLAAWKLNISTDQNKLFDPNVRFFRDYLSFTQTFPENEALYVIVEPIDANHPPAISRWTNLADAITDRLRAMPKYVTLVDQKVPLDKLGPQGLLFDTRADVQKNFADVKKFIPLVQLWAENPSPLVRTLLGPSPLERFITGLNTQKANDQTAGFVALLAKSWNESLAHPDEPLLVGKTLPDLASLDASDPSRLGYYYVPDETDPTHHLLLVRIYQRTEFNSLTAISETVDAIRDAVRDVATAYPEFHVALTGRPALEADEMRTTDTDSHHAEICALIAVFIGLVLMLRSFWLALAGEIALGVGIGWTFGWATISVGELNLLSIVFLLALIGIGMDYLVQILTRYRQEAARRANARMIWISVFHHVATPINTACAGAAGAFFVSIFTHFRGAAQLGIIAGGGLLLCLLSGYIVLPALLTIFPLNVHHKKELPDLGPPARHGMHNYILPLVWIALLFLGAPLAMKTNFDPGLLNLQAPNLESVKLVRKLQTWSAVVLSKDLQTLRQVRKAMANSPVVDRTDSILDAQDNLEWLHEHQQELPAIAYAKPQAVAESDLSRIAGKARTLANHFAKTDVAAELAKFADALKNADGVKTATRLSQWQEAFIQQLTQTLAQFYSPTLNVDELPTELKSHLVGTDGTYALYIYPKADLWNQHNLQLFVNDIESRASHLSGDYTLTGIAINIYHSTASIKTSFHNATIYALSLIVLLVFLDLRNIGQTLLAISVLALGLPMLLAVMGAMGVDWNFANFFALPILIGAGHEYGVFLVHRYREAEHDPRRVWRRWDVSDRALLLCAYVTCVSFGFFWGLAHHRGLRSLGLVMALGIACIYLASVMVLRPILIWRLRKQISQR
jgi:hopanoid biosynthesis associated RND transporter like protein HpnN